MQNIITTFLLVLMGFLSGGCASPDKPLLPALPGDLDEEALPTEYEETESLWRQAVERSNHELEVQTDHFIDGAFIVYNQLIEGINNSSQRLALKTAIDNTLASYGEMVLALRSLQHELNDPAAAAHTSAAAAALTRVDYQHFSDLSNKLRKIGELSQDQSTAVRNYDVQKAMAATLLTELKKVSFQTMNISRSVGKALEAASPRAMSFSSH